MNQAEVLCHSSGPWKKHKYFQKIGEGANAVYKYAKKKGAELADAAGVDEREEYLKRKKTSDRYEKDLEEHGYDPLDRNSGRDDTFDKYVNLNDPHDKAIRDWTNWQNNSDRWKEQGHKLQSKSYEANKKTREAASKYYKTPMGRVELSDAGKAVAKGEQILKNMFKTKTTITVTSNLMPPGTKKTVKHGEDFIEHSYKGKAWKSHKYISKKYVNGKWRYYYGSGKNDYADTRKEAEFKAREQDYNYTGEGEDHEHFDKRELIDRKNTEGTSRDSFSNPDELNKYIGERDNKLRSDINENYGANGMPSNVAKKQRENANKRFDEYFKKHSHRSNSGKF